MADFVITGPAGDRVIATCPGDTPVFDSPEMLVTAEFLISPVHPFVVEWSEYIDPDGCPNALGTLVRIPAMNRVWELYGYDVGLHMCKLRWPD